MEEPKTKKGSETKEKIYQAAIELLKEKSYRDLSIRDICKKAEVGIGTFYHYFNNKHELLNDYMSMESEHIEKAYLALKDLSNYEKMLYVLELQIDFLILKDKEFVSTALAFELTNDTLGFSIFNFSTGEILRDCIKDAYDKKEINTDFPLQTIANLFSAELLGTIIQWASVNNNINREKAQSDKEFLFGNLKCYIDMLFTCQ